MKKKQLAKNCDHTQPKNERIQNEARIQQQKDMIEQNFTTVISKKKKILQKL